MSFKFEFDADSRVLRARFQGLVNDVILGDFYSQTAAYVERTSPRAGITDFSDVTSFQVSAAAVRTMAASAPSAKDPHFLRVVVAPAAHIFGLARMFQMFGEMTRPGMVVVRSLQEALDILGVAEPHFEPVDPEQSDERVV